jgi:hypothetical protein
MATGQDLVIAVDASYRYIVEKDYGLFPIKVVNFGQTSRTLYATCNKEDKETLVWIFQNLKDEVEAVVNNRLEAGAII